jgi:tungstate transport system ATP-binding protein
MTVELQIVLRGLCFCPNGRMVLAGLDAAITSPGITAIIGPNGAGKSVTLRMIDGLLQPDSGTVRFGPRPPESIRRSFDFQRPGLIRASVARNIALALLPLRLPRAEGERRVATALARVGLADRAEDPAQKLSGGEQQRLALARAWVTEPELLLLDEPTANLDPGATEAIERLVTSMADMGTKIILVSHNIGQVARLACDVMVLCQGRIVEHGATGQILTTPRTPEARAFLNAEIPWQSFAAAS